MSIDDFEVIKATDLDEVVAEVTEIVGFDSTTNKPLKHTVTGNVETRLSDLEDDKVNTADIVNDLTTGGAAVPLSAEQGKTLKALIDAIHPVGCIYVSTVSTNPNTLFGIGTWEAYGAGRAIIGVGTLGVNTYATDDTGGATTHTLETAEMPEHTHVQNAHSHLTYSLAARTASGTAISRLDNPPGDGSVATSSTTATNQNTGGGGAHNNMQPYIAAYFWKRTA
jgi:hypothetical protein